MFHINWCWSNRCAVDLLFRSCYLQTRKYVILCLLFPTWHISRWHFVLDIKQHASLTGDATTLKNNAGVSALICACNLTTLNCWCEDGQHYNYSTHFILSALTVDVSPPMLRCQSVQPVTHLHLDSFWPDFRSALPVPCSTHQTRPLQLSVFLSATLLEIYYDINKMSPRVYFTLLHLRTWWC